jgi:hypothetical protein
MPPGPEEVMPLEFVSGSMSILRIGPVTVPLHSMVRIAMKSEMLLWLRRPRLEIQALPGVNMKCEIVEVWVGDERPNVPRDLDSLGVIRPGEMLQAILQNHMTQIVNASVVVEGDEVRVVHWAIDCGYGGCSRCRWRTECHHEACERSPVTASSCERTRADSHVRALALSTPSAGSSSKTSLWRPWNPLGR